MSVLSQDYERLQNASITNKNVVDNYKQAFDNQNITLAHQSVSECPYLVMSADNLNNLVDTINYMQQFWADDKDEFAGWWCGMGDTPTTYDPAQTYNVGQVAYYRNNPYFCIEHNTTGAFDYNKWLLMTPNNMGVTLKGEFDGITTYNDRDMAWRASSVNPQESKTVSWMVKQQAWLPVANTYPNIRYVEAPFYPFHASPNEVYITDWNGGGV